jgi:hypothetical protein
VARDPARLTAAYYNAQPAPKRMTDNLDVSLGATAVRFAPSRATDKTAFPSGGAGMVGTAGDVLTLLEAVRQGGAPILKASTVAEMMKDQVGAQAATQGPGWGFGYGWAVLDDPAVAKTPQGAGTLAWGGVYGHNWFVDPKKPPDRGDHDQHRLRGHERPLHDPGARRRLRAVRADATRFRWRLDRAYLEGLRRSRAGNLAVGHSDPRPRGEVQMKTLLTTLAAVSLLAAPLLAAPSAGGRAIARRPWRSSAAGRPRRRIPWRRRPRRRWRLPRRRRVSRRLRIWPYGHYGYGGTATAMAAGDTAISAASGSAWPWASAYSYPYGYGYGAYPGYYDYPSYYAAPPVVIERSETVYDDRAEGPPPPIATRPTSKARPRRPVARGHGTGQTASTTGCPARPRPPSPPPVPCPRPQPRPRPGDPRPDPGALSEPRSTLDPF